MSLHEWLELLRLCVCVTSSLLSRRVCRHPARVTQCRHQCAVGPLVSGKRIAHKQHKQHGTKQTLSQPAGCPLARAAVGYNARIHETGRGTSRPQGRYISILYKAVYSARYDFG